MSKKWVTLLLVVCIGLAGGVGFMRMNADTEGPEIVFTSEAPSVYRSDMSNEELLTGVTATDRKDGDVSSSLTVESVYEIDDSHVAVTYTAKDNSNNITKQKYEMEMDPSDAGKASEDTSAFGEKTDNADSAATTGVDAEQSKNPEAADHAEENAELLLLRKRQLLHRKLMRLQQKKKNKKRKQMLCLIRILEFISRLSDQGPCGNLCRSVVLCQ